MRDSDASFGRERIIAGWPDDGKELLNRTAQEKGSFQKPTTGWAIKQRHSPRGSTDGAEQPNQRNARWLSSGVSAAPSLRSRCAGRPALLARCEMLTRTPLIQHQPGVHHRWKASSNHSPATTAALPRPGDDLRSTRFPARRGAVTEDVRRDIAGGSGSGGREPTRRSGCEHLDTSVSPNSASPLAGRRHHAGGVP